MHEVGGEVGEAVKKVNDEMDDLGNGNGLYGFTEIRTKDSIFAELSESFNLEQISQQIKNLMQTVTDKLEKLDVETLGKNFADTNLELQSFLKTFSKAYGPLGPSLTEASKKFAEVSDRFKEILDPSSNFRFTFSDTLREIAAMAKSLKSLADLLERNPQAFLRGKPNPQE